MNEAHIPRRGSTMGNRKTGDLGERQAAGNQSQASGGRYDTNAVRKLAEADTKKALSKVQQQKLATTATGQRPDTIILEPDKKDVRGPGL